MNLRAIISIPTLLLALSALAITPQADTKNNRWGFMGDNGKWVVKPKYDSAQPFRTMPDGSKLSEVKLKGLIGFVDERGKLLKPGAVFESVEPLGERTALVSVKGKKGVVDYQFNYIIEPKITSMQALADSVSFIAFYSGKAGVLTRDGQWTVAPAYTCIDPSTAGYFKIYKGKKCGVADTGGKIYFEPKDYIDVDIRPDYWYAKKDEKSTGILRANSNELIIQPKYEQLGALQKIGDSYFVPFAEKGNWGVLRQKAGKEKKKVKAKNTWVVYLPEAEGFAMNRPGVGLRIWSPNDDFFLEGQLDGDDKIGPFRMISGSISYPTSHIPSSLGFGEIWNYNYGVGNSRENYYHKHFAKGRLGLITDEKGEIIATDAYTIQPADNYYMIFDSQSTGRVCDSHGRTIADNVIFYDYPQRLGSFLVFNNAAIDTSDNSTYTSTLTCDGPYLRTSDNRWHRLTDNGILSESYSEIIDDPDIKVLYLNNNGLWKIKKKGSELSGFDYTEKPEYFPSRDVFAVTKGQKKGIISATDGAELLPALYDDISIFGDYYLATDSGKKGVIKTDGSVLIPTAYDEINEGKSGYFIKAHGKLGLVSESGEMIFPAEYDKLVLRTGGEWLVCKNGKYGIASAKGKVFIPIQFASPNDIPVKNDYYYYGNNYYTDSGEIINEGKPSVTVSEIYAKGGIWFRINYDGVPDGIYIDMTVFDGKKKIVTYENFINTHIGKGQYTDAYYIDPSDMPYTWGNYYTYTVAFSFYDSKHRPIPTKGTTRHKIKYKR